METFLRGDKIQKGSIGYDALSDDAKVLIGTNGDSPFEKGDAENSAVLKGETTVLGVTYKNEALNEGCVSLGARTTAGLKGWYYKAVQIGNNSNVVYLYLTTEQQIPIFVSSANAVENQEKNININISKGDICSIINGNRLIDCFEFRLNEISNYGRISFTYKGEGTNPLSTIQNVEELKLEDYSVFCISKPSCGIVELSKCNIALGNNTKSLAESSVSIGLRSTAVGITSYAEGQDTIAVGECAHAEGAFTKSNGIASHTEGFGTQTEGLSAHAEGYNTLATGGASHSEGSATKATGLHSHAEGDTTEASGEQSHAEGKQTIAEGEHSHSEGYWTKAHGKSSHVEGQGLNNTTYSVASGDYSHSEGFYTRAFGTGSHTEGTYTIAYNKGEHAEGIYNKSTENVTLHSVGIGTSVNDRKNAHEITNDGKHYIIGVGGYDGTNTDGSKDVATVLPNMVDITYLELKSLRDNSQLVPGQQYRITDYVTTTTQQYTRIAEDYHQFDIIVVADDVNVLNENARAIQHTTDENDYFHNSNLAAWELKYCLDNDTNRFHWCGNRNCVIDERDNAYALLDEIVIIQGVEYYVTDWGGSYVPVNYTIGDYILGYIGDGDYGDEYKIASIVINSNMECKGVIYYMKDEWNNECPYDFKNIQFARWELSNPVGYRYYGGNVGYVEDDDVRDLFGSLKTGFYGLNGSNNVFYYVEYEDYVYQIEYTISNSPTYCYTFGVDEDYSLTGGSKDNVIKEYYSSNKINLNNIVFLGNDCRYNIFDNDCHSNTFGNSCTNNTFGNSCSVNTFGTNCYNNSFGNDCDSNAFGNDCYNNSFGNFCSDNAFGNFCDSNTFGNDCDSNAFGNNCDSNTFGNDCDSNAFGNNCDSNTFGNSCYDNTFGISCSNNAFGNDCYNNTFGNDCRYNILDNRCYCNTFGNDCRYNTFGNDCNNNTFGNDCRYNTFGNSCSANTFCNDCDSNTFGNSCSYNAFGKHSSSSSSYYRYIIFDDGNRNIFLNCTSTTSSTNYYQNVRIGLGVNNTDTYKTINDSNVGQTYQTLYKPTDSKELTA